MTPPPPATPGTSPFLQTQGLGIASIGLFSGGRGKGKSKITSRLISYLNLTLSYTGNLGTRLLLVLLVKHANSRLTDGTKGEIGKKSCVVLLKSVDMA